MKSLLNRWTLAAAAVLALAGCGGSDSSSDTPVAANVGEAITRAAQQASNDTASNSSASFTVLQDAGVPAVTINSPPKINFTVLSDGAVVQGLTNANVRLAIAKLVPGTNGNPDQWVNYVYRIETTTAAPNNGGPGGTPVLTSAKQATTDPNTPAQLVYNPDGYYTYTFRADITNPSWTAKIGTTDYLTDGVAFERDRTHRIAIQLSYKNKAGETVLVNPYFDFTIDASGKSVPVDASKTRKMTDVASCNSCHEKLALHGGGRIDTQYCVMCHNPRTVDANSGEVLTLSTLAHKIHSGKLLKKQLDAGKGGEDYAIWGFGGAKVGFADVGFPQDLRNCTKCHSKSAATPQGDNWKTQPSKEACLTCHANKAGSDWETTHTVYAQSTDIWAGATPQSVAKDLPDATCSQQCHKAGTPISPERVHWNQNEENGAKYKMNIESATFNDTADHKGRTVTVKYFLSDPTNGNAAYDLITPDCVYTGTAGVCVPKSPAPNLTKFGNLRLMLAYQNLVGQGTAVTEFSSYNNGGNSAAVYAHMGTKDANNHYTINIPLPDDTATAVASGTARVISIGQIKEPLVDVKSREVVLPEVPANRVNVVVQNTTLDVVISGPPNPRRTVVASEKCNACHGALGTTSGSNTLANAFHGGGRDIVEACSLCHDANRASSNIMTNGLAMAESYQFKRMIHGIHGNSKRQFPFTHGNTAIAPFSMEGVALAAGNVGAVSSNTVSAPAGTLLEPWVTGTTIAVGDPLASNVENYAAEVAWPGVGLNCNVCHVNNSYKRDRGVLGAVVKKPILVATSKADPDPRNWLVISPKAASCTACHDSPKAMGHVTTFGGATFGDASQATSLGRQETCDDCHASGGFKGVDIVHGQN